jgi:hypothetical protein
LIQKLSELVAETSEEVHGETSEYARICGRVINNRLKQQEFKE